MSQVIFHAPTTIDCGCVDGKVKVQIDISGDYEEVTCQECQGYTNFIAAKCGAKDVPFADDEHKANCPLCLK